MENRVTVVNFVKTFKESKALMRKTKILLNLLGKTGCYVEIFIVGSRIVKKNVLSFPAPKSFPRPDVQQKNLGEIYLNPRYIKTAKENLDLMLIHGLLHLLGYNHNKKSDRIKMEKKEAELLSRIINF